MEQIIFENVLILSLAILAGNFEAVQDLVLHKWHQTIFSKKEVTSWFGPGLLTWKRKTDSKYYKFFSKIGLPFIYESFSDIWHFSKTMSKFCFLLIFLFIFLFNFVSFTILLIVPFERISFSLIYTYGYRK